MGSSNREVVDYLPPYLRIYNDGTVERLMGTEFAPATFDPVTQVSSKDIIIQPAGVGARIYRPNSIAKSEKVPVVIYFHGDGGAFCISSASDPVYQNVLNILAAQAKIIIVSVDYRLVPEHPLTTAYEDSWTVLQWVISHNSGDGVAGPKEDWLKENVDFDWTFLAGDSAGANISHHMAIRAENSQNPAIKFAGVVMIHPFFWGKTPIGLEANDPVRKGIVDKWCNFVSPSDKGGSDDPLFNPFTNSNNFEGFKSSDRIIVCVAENDILIERGRLYYESFVKNGWKGKAEILESKGEDHVFHLFNPTSEKAQFLFKSIVAFINQD